MEAIIQTQSLTKEFNGIKAVKDISLEIPNSTIYALVGPTGCGKTTFLRILLGLLSPDSGHGRIIGYDILKEKNKIRKVIGYVPQEDGLEPYLSVFDNIYLFSSAYDLERKEQKRRIEEYLKYVGLLTKRDDLVKYLSSGEKKLVALLSSLIHNPALLFLDEVTTSLDFVHQSKVWDLVKGLYQKGKTILLVTHNMLEVKTLCQGMIIMDKGEILTIGKPQELLEEFKCRSLEEIMLKLVKI